MLPGYGQNALLLDTSRPLAFSELMQFTTLIFNGLLVGRYLGRSRRRVSAWQPAVCRSIIFRLYTEIGMGEVGLRKTKIYGVFKTAKFRVFVWA